MNDQNAQRKEKSLDEIIKRSLKILEKKKISIPTDLSADLLTLAQKRPNEVRESLQNGIRLTNEHINNIDSLIPDYIRNSLNIIEHRPEHVQKLYDSGLSVLKRIEDNHIIDIFSSLSDVILNAPDKFNSFMDGSEQFLQYDTQEGIIAGAYLRYCAKLMTHNPIKLAQISSYSRKIRQITGNYSIADPLWDFLKIMPSIMISYPDKADECASAFTQLLIEIETRELYPMKSDVAEEDTDFLSKMVRAVSRYGIAKEYLNSVISILKNAPDKTQTYYKEGLKLIRNKHITPRTAEGYFKSGHKILIDAPDKLKEYVDAGILYALIHEKDDPTGIKTLLNFNRMNEVLLKKPKLFNKLKRKIITEYDGLDAKLTEKNVQYNINKKRILRKYPDSARLFTEYAIKIHDLKWILGERLLDMEFNSLPLVKDSRIFKKFLDTGYKLLKQSSEAAERYFAHFKDLDAVGKININEIRKIEASRKIVNTTVRPYLSPIKRELSLSSDNPFYGGILVQRAYDMTLILLNKITGLPIPEVKQPRSGYFTDEFLDALGNNHNKKFIRSKYPNIDALLRKHVDLPDRKEFAYIDWSELEKVDNKRKQSNDLIKNVSNELEHYLNKIIKLPQEYIYEFEKMTQMLNERSDANVIKFEFSERIHDYFTTNRDCLSFVGKYFNESKNFLCNSYSTIISINEYKIDREHNDLDHTAGKIITCIAEIDNKRVWYIAGVSGYNSLDRIHEWKEEAYRAILDTAKTNADKIEGIFFDLNPRNRHRLSHDWAEYIAKEFGLVKDIDYIKINKNLTTEDFKTDRESVAFELKNPEWKEINIIRDKGLRGKFLLESVMNKPENRQIRKGSKPFLVYDKGYVIGRYVDIKEI